MAFRYSGNGWRVAHSLKTFGDQIMILRGHSTSYKVDGTLGDLAHSNRTSDHNPDENGIVRALDFYEDQPGRVDQVAEALRTARDPRLKYFIHDDRMFSSYATAQRQAWEWGPYTGPNPHTTHGHLSVVADSRADQDQPWPMPGQTQEDPMALTPSEENTAKALHAALEAAGAGTLASRTALLSKIVAVAQGAGSGLSEEQVKAIVETARLDVP